MIKVKNTFVRLIFLLLAFIISANFVKAQYHQGMVVCGYPDAAHVGLDILKKGGNAIDAAVAVQFALEVTLPEAGNIGGGGFMVYRSGKGEINTLDFREKAPAMASQNMYLDSAGNVIPDMSLLTHQATGVPGSVDGMVQAHDKYGRLAWQQLVQPAIDLA
ncbi:MAG: gamma-glutamyltransferase, partial [Mucilaginibacter sp.]